MMNGKIIITVLHCNILVLTNTRVACQFSEVLTLDVLFFQWNENGYISSANS